MNIVDVIILSIVAISTLTGLIRGLVKEVVGFVALLAGTVVASMFCKQFSLYTSKFVTDPGGASIASFMIIFLVVVLLILLIGKLLDKLVKALSLGCANHTAGLILGLLRGVLICGIILAFVEKNPVQNSADLIEKSKTAPLILKLTHRIGDLAGIDFLKPIDLKDTIREIIKKNK